MSTNVMYPPQSATTNMDDLEVSQQDLILVQEDNPEHVKQGTIPTCMQETYQVQCDSTDLIFLQHLTATTLLNYLNKHLGLNVHKLTPKFILIQILQQHNCHLP